MLYHCPTLSFADFGLFRTPGPGLGNLLFPIMRAAIGAAGQGGRLVYPTFTQIKLGTIFRRERDKRFYSDVARARRGREWVDWLASRLAGPLIDEGEVGAQPIDAGVIRYAGLRGYFHDLADHGDLARDWYFANMRVDRASPAYDLALHIRLGDFIVDTAETGGANTRTPFDWYREAIDQAARQIGVAQPDILVFTDGDFDEVRQGLKLPNMIFDESPHAAAAMARIAQARMIVTSRSTFSMWGAFLGNKPAIWDKTFVYEDYFPSRPGLDISL